MFAMEPSVKSRRELGAFLRIRRQAIEPTGVIHGSQHRRTPGLRREEVASLADVSTSLYTWLEQGRPIPVSCQALRRVASVLNFNDDETRYAIALLQGPKAPSHAAPDELTLRVLQRVVDGFADGPAFVLDVNWNFIVWNRAHALVFAMPEPGSVEPASINAMEQLFLRSHDRTLFEDWEATARRAVRKFRADYGAHVGDPDFESLVLNLRNASQQFCDLWCERRVQASLVDTDDTIHHPTLGRITYATRNFPTPQLPGGTLVLQTICDPAITTQLRHLSSRTTALAP